MKFQAIATTFVSLLLSAFFCGKPYADPIDPSLIQEKVGGYEDSSASVVPPQAREQVMSVPEKSVPSFVPEDNKALPPNKEKKVVRSEKQEIYVPYFGETPILSGEEEMTPRPKKAEKTQMQKPQKSDVAQAQRPKKGERIQIPEGAAKHRDLTFLAGCWKTDALQDFTWETGETFPIRKRFCFDQFGRGQIEIFAHGRVYRGSATAHFKGETLHIEAGYAYGSGGRRFTPETTQCTGKKEKTNCAAFFVNPKNPRQTARANYHLYRN